MRTKRLGSNRRHGPASRYGEAERDQRPNHLGQGRTYDAGLEVARQQEHTEELLATDNEHRNQWADLKEQTLAVSRNQLTFWNEAQKAAGQQIQLRDEQIAKGKSAARG